LAIVEALAAFLRTLHAVLVSECPFKATSLAGLTKARTRIDAGLLDIDAFVATSIREGAHTGRSAPLLAETF
jgi:aminoglycoside 3'-phosphotransferase-1